jgi:uncharacterized protein (DUF885 family)
MDFYIYYRLDPANAAALQARVYAMQSALAKQYGVACSVKSRPAGDVDSSDSDDSLTWMEVYLDVPASFEAALNQAANDFALTGLIEGSRHIERFMDLLPCA